MSMAIVGWMIVALILSVLAGFHIAVAMALCSFIGIWLMFDNMQIALSMLGTSAFEAIRSPTFVVIPLFVLMGDFISQSGVARDLFAVFDRLLSRVPGRLVTTTVLGNVLFGAVTGVSVASAAVFSRIAYPEMRRFGYARSYALGSIVGSACLGMLIPPSVLMIVWAVLTELSVGALFLAGILPGLLLASLFIAYGILRAVFDPNAAPDTVPLTAPAETVPAAPGTRALRGEMLGVAGVLTLIFVVIGSIWGGVATPTEAAAVGAVGALILGVATGMRGPEIRAAIASSARTTAPILFLLVAATMYSRLIAMGGAINQIQDAILGLGGGAWVAVLLMAAIWIVMGTMVDSVSIILLTVPIFAPVATGLGIDPIAFAIFGIIVIETGLLTPPFGLLVFAVRGSVPDRSVRMGEIFRGGAPYVGMLVVTAALVLIFPALATWMTGR